VRAGLLAGLEDVVAEDLLPLAPLRFRQVAQRQQGQHQRVHRRLQVRRRAAPPEIHQQVEGAQGLDVVPPQRRNEDRIAGFQFGRQRVLPGLRETREALQVGRVQVDQRDRLSGRRVVERPDVQVGQLRRREQREAPSTRDHAGDVVGDVLVCRYARAVAQPRALQRAPPAQAERVVLAETRQPAVERGRADVDRRRRGVPAMRRQRGEHVVQALGGDAEVEAAQLLVVEEAPADFRRADEGAHRLAAVELQQVARQRLVAFARGRHRRPVAHQPAQHARRVRAQQLLGQVRRIEAGAFGEGRGGRQHRASLTARIRL
jgi:hypothetical protein